MLLNIWNRDMFKPFRSHRGLLVEFLVVCSRISTGFMGDVFRETHLWEHIGWADKIALITSQKVKRIKSFSEARPKNSRETWLKNSLRNLRPLFLKFAAPKFSGFLLRGGVRSRNKGGCKRVFAFVHVCSRLIAFVCVFASAFACVCKGIAKGGVKKAIKGV